MTHRPFESISPWPRAALAAAVSAAILSACAVGPAYERPTAAVSAAYKEAPAADAGWLPAAPADALDRGEWWTLFGDAQLDGLMQQVQVSNQNVAAAVAAYDQARALVRQQRATLFPAVTLDGSAARTGGNGRVSGTGNSTQLGLGASWEPDLWGQLRLGVQSAQASAQASEADLAAARLSAQGELAIDYFSLRDADAELALLATTVDAFQRSLTITQNRYAAAIAAKTDVLQAQTQLANAKADVAALRGQRANLEHAIAVLIGKAPGDFSLPPGEWKTSIPAVPLGVPSTLLQRRPDIASSERAVAAANAQIGIQRSAYYPSINLSGSFGTAGSSIGDLFKASNTLWSLGLSAAQTVFDAGAIAARVEGAEAARDAAAARYRQTVLSAFQAVEDQLSTTRALAEQDALRREASQAADATEQQLLNRYKAGLVSYTEVVTAQASALSARRTLAQLVASRQTSAVALIQALGGGWHAREPMTDRPPASRP
ncbi:efflux transporter outer membrane subunit [soil metagenome]